MWKNAVYKCRHESRHVMLQHIPELRTELTDLIFVETK